MNWLFSVTLAVALAVASGAPTARAPEPGAIKIGHDPQLLLDDYLVRTADDVATVQNRPDGGQVVLTADRPWEQRIFYPSVIRTGPSGYLMFYNLGRTDDPHRNDIAVARSSDGLHFTKRATAASGDTNVVVRNAHGPTAIEDERDPDSRYRLLFYRGEGICAAHSADGDTFQDDTRCPLLANKSDTQQSVVWDAGIGKWVMFTRFWEKPEDGRPGWTRFNGDIRAVARSESSDFVHWTPLKVILRRGVEDAALSDFYGLQVTIRDGAMIGFLWTSHWDDDSGRLGVQDAQLVVSRDHGLTWSRVNAAHPFFERGAAGGFDSQIVWPSTLIDNGKTDFIYYLGANRKHGADEIANFPRDKYRIGMRTIGHDRFAARAAGDRQGELTTKLLDAPASRALSLNATIEQGGFIRTILETADGRRLGAGKLIAPRDAIRIDAGIPAAAMRAIGDRPVRLRFELRRAQLYSFSFD